MVKPPLNHLLNLDLAVVIEKISKKILNVGTYSTDIKNLNEATPEQEEAEKRQKESEYELPGDDNGISPLQMYFKENFFVLEQCFKGILDPYLVDFINQNQANQKRFHEIMSDSLRIDDYPRIENLYFIETIFNSLRQNHVLVKFFDQHPEFRKKCNSVKTIDELNDIYQQINLHESFIALGKLEQAEYELQEGPILKIIYHMTTRQPTELELP